jgi:hypothetical protein
MPTLSVGACVGAFRVTIPLNAAAVARGPVSGAEVAVGGSWLGAALAGRGVAVTSVTWGGPAGEQPAVTNTTMPRARTNVRMTTSLLAVEQRVWV